MNTIEKILKTESTFPQPSDRIQIEKSYQNLFLIFLNILTISLYFKTCNYDFINLDDGLYVFNNTHITNGLTLASAKWAFLTGYAGNWHPITWISLQLDVSIFGVNPGAHHLINVLFHCINSSLLYILIKRITKSNIASAMIALLFAIHPLHVESVAWISERKDVLSTLFFLITCIKYVQWTEKPSLNLKLQICTYFVLGLMTKSMLVTLPVIFLLLDYWPLNRLPQSHISFKSIYVITKEKIPYIAISLFFSAIAIFTQHASSAVANLQSHSPYLRITNSINSYAQYFFDFFIPSRLSVFYPYIDQTGKTASIKLASSILLIIAISYLCIKKRNSSPYLLVGWLWFIITLLPVIGLVQVGSQSHADRYMYIPSIGLSIMATWYLKSILETSQKYRLITNSAILFGIVALYVQTSIQTSYWKNDISIFEHATQVTQYNEFSHLHLYHAYLKSGNYQKAAFHGFEAMQINPSNPNTHYLLGIAQLQLNDINRAIESFNKVYELKASFRHLDYYMGKSYLLGARYPEAILYYRRFLTLHQNSSATPQSENDYYTTQAKTELNIAISHTQNHS